MQVVHIWHLTLENTASKCSRHWQGGSPEYNWYVRRGGSERRRQQQLQGDKSWSCIAKGSRF